MRVHHLFAVMLIAGISGCGTANAPSQPAATSSPPAKSTPDTPQADNPQATEFTKITLKLPGMT